MHCGSENELMIRMFRVGFGKFGAGTDIERGQIFMDNITMRFPISIPFVIDPTKAVDGTKGSSANPSWTPIPGVHHVSIM